MSFAWLEYVALAEALLQAPTTFAPAEACARAAISRAYYGVYGAARQRAQDADGLQLPPTGDAHQLVMSHYYQGATPLHRAIGDTLRQLRSARNRADYADELDRPEARAAFAVRRARQVMAQLQALPPPAPPPSSP